MSTDFGVWKEKLSHNTDVYQPAIFDRKNSGEQKALDELLLSQKVLRIIDRYDEQADELLVVRDPSLLHKGKRELPSVADTDGVWVYFPWNGYLIHTLLPKEYVELRYSRNAGLITKEEQEKFTTKTIGVAGLNVGNPGAICMALEGGPRTMKFADFDPLSVTNLNRFRAGISSLGENKAILTARQAYDIDPFLDITVFEKGITKENIEDFLMKPKLDLLVEEMDNLPLKIEIRERARAHGIPVIMVTGNGENVIVDIERYDLDKNLPLLNGHLKKEVVDGIHDASKPKSLDEKVLLARDFMGKEYLTKRLQEAFLEVGKTVPSIPQIAESSFLRGATISYVARMVLTGAHAPSGRYTLCLDSVIS